ncbi:MAG: NAD+ synthase [Planctomycetota bacterium]
MIRIALCQLNPTVGDIQSNLGRIERAARESAAREADLALLPELVLSGYPPEDLLLRPRFVEACQKALFESAPRLAVPALVGLPYRDPESGALWNAAAFLQGGTVRAVYGKRLLPNYGVFDEKRYFAPGAGGLVLETGEERLGVVICEDAWEEDGPARDEAAAGAGAILCLSASPFHREKGALREEAFARLCRAHGVSFLCSNLVGGQDELVFDGASLFLDPSGQVLARGAPFEEGVFCVEVDACPGRRRSAAPRIPVLRVPLGVNAGEKKPLPALKSRTLSAIEEIYACLVLGVRDYVRKNGFSRAALGLSGGVDSSLSACVAVDALGPENVTGVLLPSRYTSGASRDDAEALAQNLGIPCVTISIESAYAACLAELAPVFAGRAPDLAEENLQARLRAVYLMALANKFGWLVLNTSNKSEAAVGFGTMYGDMIGAYAVLKDVFKTMVYRLARLVNERAGFARIPEPVLEKAPTAELRPGQLDADSIPEYELLDPVLEAYIERDQGVDEMIAQGFDPELVRAAVRLTDAAEWKRRQGVPGVRVTPKAFGKDRRLPITNRYQG